jgi:FkbM family methyltransferase
MRKKIGDFLKKVFPKRMFSYRSYAQDGEDVVLYAYYKYKKRNHKGFYIDIGAHHPFRFSNTAFFYERGWCGINIEPTPHLMNAFHKHRKRDNNLNIAVSDSTEKLTFFEFNEPAINGFDEALSMERAQSPQYTLLAKREIDVYTLKDVLDKELPKGQEIDFITIDVEGHDLNILRSNDWDKYLPHFILIEGELAYDSLNTNEIYNYLKDKNYQMVAKTKRTLLFKSNRHF